MAYLKYLKAQNGGGAPGTSGSTRVRLKSKGPKRMNSLIQGVLAEFAQPNPSYHHIGTIGDHSGQMILAR
jgi:hypothetical protein